MLGVMQGRFINKGGFFPQTFPWENWQEEFYIAKENDIECLEWMFNADRFYENPIWTEQGNEEIKAVILDSGVIVSSICMNYFMQHSLVKDKDSLNVLKRLIENAKRLGINKLIIPLFEESEILDIDELYKVSGKISKMVSGTGISIGFESNLSVEIQKRICGMFPACQIGICYDVGNMVGCGFDNVKELSKIKDYLLEIHLKDKAQNGRSVMLGEGKVNFQQLFQFLKRDEERLYILESFFDKNAKKDTVENIRYIRGKMYG